MDAQDRSDLSYDGCINRDDWDGESYAQGSATGYVNPETDTVDDHELYATELRGNHAREMDYRKRGCLDPGYQKFEDFKRRAHAGTEKALHRAQQRRELHIARQAGYQTVEEMPVEELEAELHRLEDIKGDQQLRAAMVAVMIADDKYPATESGCYRRLKKGLTDDEKDRIEFEARQLIEANGHDQGRGHRCQRLRLGEYVAPLPVREPGLSEANRIVAERDINKAEVREQLKRDTERFLAEGGVIQDLGKWMPSDPDLIFMGEVKSLPFNMWTDGGGTARKPRKPNRGDIPVADRRDAQDELRSLIDPLSQASFRD